MDFLEWCARHWFLAFCLIIGAYNLSVVIVTLPHRMLARLYRVLMVRKQGWPPSHLDADGDWKPEPKADAS